MFKAVFLTNIVRRCSTTTQKFFAVESKWPPKLIPYLNQISAQTSKISQYSLKSQSDVEVVQLFNQIQPSLHSLKVFKQLIIF